MPDRSPPAPEPRRAGRALELPVSGETEPLVLARGNSFCVTNRRGDIAPAGARDLGLFHDDTRHLSFLELHVSGTPPVVLSSETAGAAASQTDLTLTDLEFGGFLEDPQNFMHIRRKHLLDGELVQQIVLTNHLRKPVRFWLELRMDADFADVFEVRGARRTERGRLLDPVCGRDHLVFSYEGLDGLVYRTVVRMFPEPTQVSPTGPRYELELMPGEATILEIMIQPTVGPVAELEWIPFDVRLARWMKEHESFKRSCTAVDCRNTAFTGALLHDLEDIDALRLRVGARSILGAGIPWFAAPFGRDSLLTSLELLSIAPDLAAETLRTLAVYQGTRDDPWREEEPGRIMHELRRGEMARTGEVPHSPYYGTIDATPLWLILLGETWRWTGDAGLVKELMPNAERALAWIDRRLSEGRGFLRYRRHHKKGLENQGWKDSRDGVSFPDGTIAQPPIALIEVQGYVVAAFEAMAALLSGVFGDRTRAEELRRRAGQLRLALDEAFWVPATRFYALALDGEGRQVPTITSNPGHLLFCRAVEDERARRIFEVLLGDGMYTGWGVRTLARGQAVFNPLSYHNGSVWPHDNALCALGASLYGINDGAMQLLEGLYNASLHFRRHRLPELFCGLGRSEGDFLVHYPVSCSPQAWASGAFFLLLQAALGLRPDAPRRTLLISNPRLPSFLDRLTLLGMRVGRSRVSLRFTRTGARTHADLLELEGEEPLRVHIEIG